MMTRSTTLALAAAAVSAAAVSAAAVSAADLQFALGNPAYVLYPRSTGQPSLPDQSTLVLNFSTSNSSSSSVLRGYQAFSDTILFLEGPSLSYVLQPPYKNVTQTWDVEAAVVSASNPSLAHAFIHREYGWDVPPAPGGGPTDADAYRYNGRITYAESNDAGLSFVPYPPTGNLNDTNIITSSGPMNIGGANNTGTGPHWAVTVEDPPGSGRLFIQIITQDCNAEVDPATGANGTAFVAARSRMEDGGRPGTWLKLFRGAWTEPGLGGRASAIPGLAGSKMVWAKGLNVWLAVGYGSELSVTSDPAGVSGWAQVPTAALPPPLPASVQPVSRHFAFPDHAYYQSFVPGYGGTTWDGAGGDSLNLFFAYTAPSNESWATVGRGLASAQMTVVPRNTTEVPNSSIDTTIAPYAFVSLSQYFLKSGGGGGAGGGGAGAGGAVAARGPKVDKWATIWPVDQSVYDYGWHVAFLLATPADYAVVATRGGAPAQGNVTLLVDCYIVESNDHFVALEGECQQGAAPNLRYPEGRDASTTTLAYLGPLGYAISTNRTGVAGEVYSTMPVWRCYDAAGDDHVLVPLEGCPEGDTFATFLGYIFWAND